MSHPRKAKKDSSRNRRSRTSKEAPTQAPKIEPQHVIKTLLALLFCLTIVLICFVGQFPSGLQVLPNQVSKIRIVTDFPFSYQSTILTKHKEDLLRKQIAPVYTIDTKPFQDFKTKVLGLVEQFDTLEQELLASPQDEHQQQFEALSQQYFNETGSYVSPDKFALILSSLNKDRRQQIFAEGLNILRNVTLSGIYKPTDLEAQVPSNSPFFYSIEIAGRSRDVKVQSQVDTLRFMLMRLQSLGLSLNLATAVRDILEPGVKPNLVYDSDRSEKKIQAAISGMQPIVVHVKAGQTIIEPGSKIGPEQMEQLQAYREFEARSDDASFGFNTTLRDRIVLTLIILLTAILYARVSIPNALTNNRKLAIIALTIISNLIIIRLALELGDTDLLGKHQLTLSILPFICPFALSPIVTTLILGPRPGTLVAVIVSSFYALMLGTITDFLLISLFSSLIAIYFSINVTHRSQVIRAGTISGIAVATIAFLLGFFNEVPLETIGYQVLFSLITGTLTGILVIGVLPMLEHIFKYTTNITFLELTDYNHPLLRRLQIEAPGTYHHSIMVANLSERAALEIDANPLICRVCSLFHDIGKTIKPEYFVENQTEGLNPHLDRNPSMSALVIKSHVKEGVAMAKQHNLPQQVIDVIEQHHGTTLIQYFYDKALKQKSQTELPFPNIETPDPEPTNVDESTFRYDGPRPQFKESAIIFFADSVEAASRTLKKASSTNIKDLINRIVQEKLNDNQLDESPLNFRELDAIKQSFHNTLLSMLHARIDYPAKEEESNVDERIPHSIDSRSS